LSRAAQPLDPWRWLGIPALLCIAASVVFATPLKVFGLQLPEPVFALVPAFAWAVIRPSVLAPFVLLAMGVFLDALWGTPLGLWALSLLVAYASVLASRSMMSGQSSAVMWAWYAAVTALAMFAGYVFTIMTAQAGPAGIVVFWQFVWTAILYPFAHRLIGRFEDADVRFR
jgi:rod shape-determining protein MreD